MIYHENHSSSINQSITIIFDLHLNKLDWIWANNNKSTFTSLLSSFVPFSFVPISRLILRLVSWSSRALAYRNQVPYPPHYNTRSITDWLPYCSLLIHYHRSIFLGCNLSTVSFAVMQLLPILLISLSLLPLSATRKCWYMDEYIEVCSIYQICFFFRFHLWPRNTALLLTHGPNLAETGNYYVFWSWATSAFLRYIWPQEQTLRSNI